MTPVLEDADFVKPSGGLSLGDFIVVAGQSGLKDGSRVRLPGDPEPDDEGSDGGQDDA